tara:strand:- start:1433 stop:1708 length:276 start_codon:yes stop_codon:yes gene_type:complete
MAKGDGNLYLGLFVGIIIIVGSAFLGLYLSGNIKKTSNTTDNNKSSCCNIFEKKQCNKKCKWDGTNKLKAPCHSKNKKPCDCPTNTTCPGK